MPSAADLQDALLIPYVTPQEAERLMLDEFHCLLAVLDSLHPEDWERPTACVLWNVRDVAAHQAGGYASGTGYHELFHQYTALPRRGQLPEDAINARQLAERAGRTPADLIAELRGCGERAIHNWAYGFRLFKVLGVPHPPGGWLSMRHLMLAVHSRDTWMHRLDICRATGRPFEQTREHDGRINELVVRDLAGYLPRALEGRAIALDLTGMAGGRWRIGRGEPSATIRMDTLDFNIYASGRFSYGEAAPRAVLAGDQEIAARALKNIEVMY